MNYIYSIFPERLQSDEPLMLAIVVLAGLSIYSAFALIKMIKAGKGVAQ